jgi:SAM-dependent methyltransferase
MFTTKGAIELAKTEQSNGKYAAATALPSRSRPRRLKRSRGRGERARVAAKGMRCALRDQPDRTCTGGDHMPVMSAIESSFCRSAPWRYFAVRFVLPWALEGHRLSGDVLEIGSGSGAMANAVAKTFPNVHLTVTDIDEAMVSQARALLAYRENVHVEQADVTALPFEDSTFDAVTSYLMLHHVIAWPVALTEAVRVLRPGGTLVGYDLTNTRAARVIHLADRSPHRILSATDLIDGLAEAGLTAVAVRLSLGGHLMRFRAEKSADIEEIGDRADVLSREVTVDAARVEAGTANWSRW